MKNNNTWDSLKETLVLEARETLFIPRYIEISDTLREEIKQEALKGTPFKA